MTNGVGFKIMNNLPSNFKLTLILFFLTKSNPIFKPILTLFFTSYKNQT